MKRHEALKIVFQSFSENDLVISSTGNLSREIAIIADSARIFYMMGSMGLASSIGLGLALCMSNKRIIIIEGDGSVLMNMGSLATIGHYSPLNLVHIVLDNEVYDSTGGQASVSSTANLDKIAIDVGYNTGRKVTNEHELREALKDNLMLPGSVFIQVKVEIGGIADRIPRVPYEPEEVRNRFKEVIETNQDRI